MHDTRTASIESLTDRACATAMALLLAVALVLVPLATSAAAAGDPTDFFICVGGEIFDDVDDAPANVVTPGADAVIVVGMELQEWTAGSRPVGFDDRCVLLDLGDVTGLEAILRLIDPAAPLIALDWTVLDASLVGGGTAAAAPEDVTWTLNLDREELRTVDIFSFEFEPTAYDPHPEGLVEAGTYSSAIFLTVSGDLVPGSYVLNFAVIFTDETSTSSFPVLVPFEVVADVASAPRGPVASVSCGAPTVGAAVSCTLTSAPSFDFVWQASTNPVFASGVVTTDATGTGEFSFTVPPSAVGLPVLVEIVDWTGAEAIGVASPPVPSTVPAGERGEVPVGMLVMLLLGVVALLGGMARVRTEVGGVSRVSR